MRALRPLAALAAALAAAAVLVSGGDGADPRTPPALPGLPPPFLGTALAGSGGLTEAVDAYGNVVGLWAPGPAGTPEILNSSARQAAGTVPPDTGMVIRAGRGGQPVVPLWEARRVEQSYLPGTSVALTAARLHGGTYVRVLDAVAPGSSALERRFTVLTPGGTAAVLQAGVSLTLGGTGSGQTIRLTSEGFVQRSGSHEARCSSDPAPVGAELQGPGSEPVLTWRGHRRLRVKLVCAFDSAVPSLGEPAHAAVAADRRWLAGAAPLGPGAPPWAKRLYDRSLLVVRALTDRRTGAVAAGARDGWAYVWPRDAAATALALRGAGYPSMARRIARFLDRLDLGAAARFDGNGTPIPGRAAQGDAEGWRRVADRAGGLPVKPGPADWRGRADYGERSGGRGDYLANAIAAGVPAARIRDEFGYGGRLVRTAGDPSSSIDSAVAWAARPFPRPSLAPEVRASLRQVLRAGSRFGIPPALDWPGGQPWTAPTAWVAWSLASLGDRTQALKLLAGLRAAATPAGDLPERVSARAGIPRSTTPLAWSHAFTILALRELWPTGD